MELLDFYFSFSSSTRVLIDLLLVTFVLYNLYRFLVRSRAVPVIFGIFLLFSIVLVARLLNLNTILWLFETMSPYILIASVIILQPEIRKIVYDLGEKHIIRQLFTANSNTPIEVLIETITTLTERKWGALLVFKYRVNLYHLVDAGITLDAKLSRELLLNIISPKAALHDGAIIIAGDRILSVATYLPFSTASTKLQKEHGARHRAGVGITEESDCFTVIISEETGNIGVAYLGELQEGVSIIMLKALLSSLGNNRIMETWGEFFSEDEEKNEKATI